MRAVVHDRYGPPQVLRVDEVERPVPADDELLIRVRPTTVNRTDCHRRAARPFVWRFMAGLLRPRRRIIGGEVAGQVEAVGAGVVEFAVGDEVFGTSGPNVGGQGEYLCRRESGVVAHKPTGLTFEEAAAVPDGAPCALTCLRGAGVKTGQALLETYDVVFDAVGKLTFQSCKSLLKPGRIDVATDGFLNFPLSLWTSRVGDKRVSLPLPDWKKEDIVFLKQLVEAGEYRPVIDRRYRLEEVVEATRYVETGQKVGNVVLTLDGGTR